MPFTQMMPERTQAPDASSAPTLKLATTLNGDAAVPSHWS